MIYSALYLIYLNASTFCILLRASLLGVANAFITSKTHFKYAALNGGIYGTVLGLDIYGQSHCNKHFISRRMNTTGSYL